MELLSNFYERNFLNIHEKAREGMPSLECPIFEGLNFRGKEKIPK